MYIREVARKMNNSRVRLARKVRQELSKLIGSALAYRKKVKVNPTAKICRAIEDDNFTQVEARL